MERVERRDLKRLVTKEMRTPVQANVSADIEEHYAEIGRAVVANAVMQVQDQLSRIEQPTREDFTKVVAAVPVWVTAKPDLRDPSLISEVCCVCTRGDAGVIICRGGCC
jgi:hypothetical protein